MWPLTRHTPVAAVALAIASAGFGGCGLNPEAAEPGPHVDPRAMRPSEYYLAAGQAVVLWRSGGRLHAYVRVGSVYGSSDDDDADRYKPALRDVRVDGRRLEQVKVFPPFHDPRGSTPRDGGASPLSGWTVDGRFVGTGSASRAREVAAVMCWPEHQGCARVTLYRCRRPGALRFGPRVTLDSTERPPAAPVGARRFYGPAEARSACGSTRIERLHH